MSAEHDLLERIAALSAEIRAKQVELAGACSRYAASVSEGDGQAPLPRPPTPPRGRPAKGGRRPGPKPARKAAATPAHAPARHKPGRRAARGAREASVVELLGREGPMCLAEISAALCRPARLLSSQLTQLVSKGVLVKREGRGTPYALAGAAKGPAADRPSAERKRRPAAARSLLSGGPLGADDDELGEGEEEDEDDEGGGEAVDQADDGEEDDEDEDGAKDRLGRKKPHVLGRYERKAQRFSSTEPGSLHQRIVDHLGKVGRARSDEIAKALGVDTPTVQRGLWSVQRDKRVVKDESTRPALWSLPGAQRGAA